jgi:hypothetical protein
MALAKHEKKLKELAGVARPVAGVAARPGDPPAPNEAPAFAQVNVEKA